MEINPISQSIPVDDFESKVFRLALTGAAVTPDNLQDCHSMKNKEKVIIKFKDRKHKNKSHFQLEGTKIIKKRATRRLTLWLTVWSIIFHK